MPRLNKKSHKKPLRTTLAMKNTTLNLPCREAFDRQQMARQSYPLQSGQYKLRETRDYLDKMLCGFDNIVEYQHRDPKPTYRDEDLGGFLAWETQDRLRNIPIMLVEMAGYNLQPGLLALTKEGVPQALVDLHTRLLKPFMDQFIAECDEAHDRLQAPLQSEYDKLAAGESELVWLTRSLFRQVEDILALCEGTANHQSVNNVYFRPHQTQREQAIATT